MMPDRDATDVISRLPPQLSDTDIYDQASPALVLLVNAIRYNVLTNNQLKKRLHHRQKRPALSANWEVD
jgi:hypothetical protein